MSGPAWFCWYCAAHKDPDGTVPDPAEVARRKAEGLTMRSGTLACLAHVRQLDVPASR